MGAPRRRKGKIGGCVSPVRVVVNPGDGSAPLFCNGTPPAVTRANHREDIPGWRHTYRDSSAMAPNGETSPVTATIAEIQAVIIEQSV